VLHTTKSIVLILRSCDKTEVLNNNMADCVSLPDKRHDNIGDVSKLPCDNETTNSRAQRWNASDSKCNAQYNAMQCNSMPCDAITTIMMMCN